MNDPDTDFLKELGSSWQSMETPQFDDAGDAPRDEATQVVISHLRQAWQDVRVPEFNAPAPRRRQSWHWRKSASIAAAMILVAVTIWSFASAGSPEAAAPRPGTEIAELPLPAGSANQSQANAGSEMSATPLENGGIVVKKGRVRLILVQPLAMDEPANMEDEE